MNINLTLLIQMAVFATLVWFTMRFVWPLIVGAMEEREKRIATGLAAAEKGQKALDEANIRAGDIIREARDRAQQIIDQANRRSSEMIESAKLTAKEEGGRLVAAARAEAATEANRARDALRRELGGLVVAGAAKVLGREIDPRTHAQLLEQLADEIARG
ncbi:MAG: F0F1 ATP synthase subunit B [Steroidobacteraceae bacterium]|nr:F0F1 ATP synthase subunit B [Steroidobacteraceae bacterium]MDW8257940.1 F0F1 ATP synthase subunit B [Gammaproteobacteria bacterium]